MNQIRTDEETVENRILKIIHLDEQIAGLNNEAQHLTGDLEQRRADGRRINMERRRKNAERRRIVQEIRRHTPTRPVLRRTMPLTLSPVTSRVDVPIYEHGSPISASPNSPTSLHLSDLELSRDSEIIDVDDSPPGYTPLHSPDNSPPGTPGTQRQLRITPPPRSRRVPSAPTRSRHRGPVGGTKKKKGKKRKYTKKKKAAKKGKKTKKR
jgi:hypothetical protein